MAQGLRECCLDTETTGLDPREGHRLIEVACVEIVDKLPTGRTLHEFIDPERDVPMDVVQIHGITSQFLQGKPKFKAIKDKLLDFIGDAPIVAHNAPFDVKFLNAELDRIGAPRLTNLVVDTVPLAKRVFPGAKVTLDALCRKFGIDLSSRTVHGALVDTQLLANVYLELCGGRHHSLKLEVEQASKAASRPFRIPRLLGVPSASEIAAHQAFLNSIKGALWMVETEAQESAVPRP